MLKPMPNSTTVFQRPEFFLHFPRHEIQIRYRCFSSRKASIVSHHQTMTFNPPASLPRNNEHFSEKYKETRTHHQGNNLKCSSDLLFDNETPHQQEEDEMKDFEFVVRKAELDEEFWTAAWLRAESMWEDRPHERHASSYKRKYAEQEFNALKRRSKEQFANKICIIAVRKEEGEEPTKTTTLRSVVGTLDLNTMHLLNGETYPGEVVKAGIFSTFHRRNPERYGHITNLCVPKFARRQGIASKMLHFAIESAKSDGLRAIFVEVHRWNEPAQKLYHKIGFETVEKATPHFEAKQTYLLVFKA